MEQFEFPLNGSVAIDRLASVGNVGSGDLEVVLIPSEQRENQVIVKTTVNNKEQRWQRIIEDVFKSESIMATVRINDFGATPGVVKLRLKQALELAQGHEIPVVETEFGMPFSELSTFDRAASFFDKDSYRELCGSDKNIISPWLEPQGIVTKSDDGCIILKGTIQQEDAVVISVDGTFQGGAIGEVSGAKIAAALEMALEDNRNGCKCQVIVLLESGGVRLQEANLGFIAIADIHSNLVQLREYVNVIGVIAGNVGCFGGMAGDCRVMQPVDHYQKCTTGAEWSGGD